LPFLEKLILENISMADIIRGSDEDFENIFNVKSSKETFEQIKKAGCQNLIYTASERGVFIHSEKFIKHYPVPTIKPVSTIGAGDNFNAGIIYTLYSENIFKDNINQIPEKKWDIISRNGIDFAQEVCMNWENYISKKFAEKYK
jgi:fructokinase